MNFSQKANISRVGVQLTGLMFEKHGYIFREQPVSDCGIDAHIERVEENNKASGELIALQIKSGKSWFREKNETGFVYRGKKSHLNYWLGHSLPVLIILCDIQGGNIYWQSISEQTVKYTPKGWKVTIPFIQQVNTAIKESLLNENLMNKENSARKCSDELKEVVNQLQLIDESAAETGRDSGPAKAEKQEFSDTKEGSETPEEPATKEVVTSDVVDRQWFTVFKRASFYLYSIFCLFALFKDSIGHDGHFSFSLLIRSMSFPGQGESLFVVLTFWCLWFMRHSGSWLFSFNRQFFTDIRQCCQVRPRLMMEVTYLAKMLFFYLYCIFCILLLFSASLDQYRNISWITFHHTFSQTGSLLTILVLFAIGVLLFIRGYLPGRRKHYSSSMVGVLFLIKGAAFYGYTIYCLSLLIGASLDFNDKVSFFHLMDEFFISDGGSVLLFHTVMWFSWCFYRTFEPGYKYYSPRVREVIFSIKRTLFYCYSGVCLSMVSLLLFREQHIARLFRMDDIFHREVIAQCLFLTAVWVFMLVRWYLPGKKSERIKIISPSEV